MTKKRDIGQEILEGVRAIRRGKGRRHEVRLPKVVTRCGIKKSMVETKRGGPRQSKT